MKNIITRRSLLAFAAASLLAVPTAAEASSATRRRRRRIERERSENDTAIRALELERAAMRHHKHPTHADKLLAHARLAEIEQELEWRRSRGFY